MPRNLILAIALPLAASVVLLSTVQAQAQNQAQNQAARGQPTRIGTFQSWIAAHTQEQGQKVCYAFANPTRSEGGPQNRATVTLTVTHRPTGRDQVAISVGYPYSRQAEAVLTVGTTEFRSYATVQSSAFFQNGAQLIVAFRNGREAVVRSPGPPGRSAVTDTFPLAGFSAAYQAISRECPPPRPAR